jgi:hypothetical protein
MWSRFRRSWRGVGLSSSDADGRGASRLARDVNTGRRPGAFACDADCDGVIEENDVLVPTSDGAVAADSTARDGADVRGFGVGDSEESRVGAARGVAEPGTEIRAGRGGGGPRRGAREASPKRPGVE